MNDLQSRLGLALGGTNRIDREPPPRVGRVEQRLADLVGEPKG